MFAKILTHKDETTHKLKAGVDKLANMVKVTLGPRGRNVIIDRKVGSPTVTKDGVTVAKHIFLEDPVENMAAQLLKEVASQTAELAGDGTTTATVLAQAIYAEGLKYTVAGSNAMDVKRGIDKAVEYVVKQIKELAVPVSSPSEIESIGTISANGDAFVGKLLSDAMQKVGNGGIISMDDSRSTETTVEVSEGMEFDRGWISPFFVTKPDRMLAEATDPHIMIVNKVLASVEDIEPFIPLWNSIAGKGETLLLIAKDITGDTLKTLVVNHERKKMKVCAVKAPGFGDRMIDILGDVACMTGTVVIDDTTFPDFRMIKEKNLGRAEKFTVSQTKTTIVAGAGDSGLINERVQHIRQLIEAAANTMDRQKLETRLASMVAGVAVIKVGASTEAEQKELKFRIEDALFATRAAVAEGIVAGGGTFLAKVSTEIVDRLQLKNPDENNGAMIVAKALTIPLMTIAENAGVSGEVVLADVLKTGNLESGYDAQKLTLVDMFKAGIIDPAKVVRLELQNAASIAGLLLTTSGAIADSNVEKKFDEDIYAKATLN